MYFDRKPGAGKNLDIVVNGLATYFYAIAPSNNVLFEAVYDYFDSEVETDYQDISGNADSDNLFFVTGDEYN